MPVLFFPVFSFRNAVCLADAGNLRRHMFNRQKSIAVSAHSARDADYFGAEHIC